MDKLLSFGGDDSFPGGSARNNTFELKRVGSIVCLKVFCSLLFCAANNTIAMIKKR